MNKQGFIERRYGVDRESWIENQKKIDHKDLQIEAFGFQHSIFRENQSSHGLQVRKYVSNG